MSWDPLLPLWLLVLLIAAGPVVILSVYRRWQLPTWCRLGAWLVLALMLLNPVRVEPVTDRQTPSLALVVDRSASMAAVDQDGGSRLQAGRRVAMALETALTGRYRIEPFGLAETLTPGLPLDAGGATDFASLADFAERDDLAAIILCSDGVDRGDRPPDQALAAAHRPVFAVPLGRTTSAPNLVLQLQPATPTAFLGQELALEVELQASGAAVGKACEVVLQRQDGTVLRQVVLTPTPTASFTVIERVGEAAGEAIWTATAAVVDGEVSQADNRAQAIVQVVDRRLRLAVLEGRPYWDTSFALRAWRRDQQLAVQAVFRLGGRRYASGDDEALPMEALLQPAGLAELDLVVVGDLAEDLLDAEQQAALVAFADAGGGLLFLGRRAALQGPLAAADPVLRRDGASQTVRPRLTGEGESAALLPMDLDVPEVTADRVAGLRPRSTVLLAADELPLVVERRYGAGRVATVNAEGIWRWTLALGSDSEAPPRFWRQLVKRLVRQHGTRLALDRPRYRVGQEAMVSLAGAPAAAGRLQVRAPDGQQRAMDLTDGSTRVQFDRPGLWLLQHEGLSRSVAVAADEREVVDRARRDARLLQLTGTTGGDLVAPEEVEALADRLTRRADLRTVSPQRHPLILLPWWLLVCSACLGLEWWWRRRRWGAI